MSNASNPRGPLPPPPPLSQRMPNGVPLLKVPVGSDPEPPPVAMSPPPPLLAASPPPPKSPLQANAPPARDIAAQIQQGAQAAQQETVATLRALRDMLGRLLAFGRSGYEQRRLSQELLESQKTLGRKIELAGLGDAALRAQLAQLVERRKSVEAAQGPVKVLDAERRGLHLRLAAPYLQSAAPPGLELEHRRLLELQQELQATSARLGQQRTSLLPEERRDRMRILAGGGALAALLLVSFWMFWPGGKSSAQSARRWRPALQPSQPAEPTILPAPVKKTPAGKPVEPPAKPVEAAPQKSAAPVTREKWVDEDDYFPRRKVIATYVDDQPHGEVKCFDAQDRLICVEPYERGVLQGKRISYYPSGKKFAETTFVQGVAQGTSTTWFENGKVAGTVEFVKGQITGPSVTYFSNGNKSVVNQMVNGIRHGESTHFLPNGQPFAAVDWVDGVEVNREVVLDVSQQDFAVINERSNFSSLLKDWWR